MRTAICPGSFDPITVGHLDLVERASRIFDEVIVCVMANGEKRPMFTLDERLELARAALPAGSRAGQLAGEVSVANCGVEMHFEGGRLTSVSGAHVSMEGAVPEPGARMTCVTALMKFLDHRNASGAVCSEVRDVQCVYQLRGASTPRLRPVWEIRTDTYTYYVDCETGEVTGR